MNEIETKLQEINIDIGRAIRKRRRQLNLSLSKLSESIGVTYQQLAKYETGVNRVSAASLAVIADALGVDVGYFYASKVK